MLRENDGREATGAGETAGLRLGRWATKLRNAGTTPKPRKALIVAISIVVAIGTLTGVAFSQRPQRTPEEYSRRNRKVSIKPKQPAKGIASGFVVAYGHRIRPPFLIELRGDRIYVNDVQVMPSLLSEMEATALPKPPEKSAHDKAVGESLYATSNAIREMARKGAPKKEIYDFARNQAHVRSVAWKESGALEVTGEVDGSFLIILPSPGEKTLTKEERKARSDDALRRRVASIRKDLERDRFVIFVDGGLSVNPRNRHFPGSILRIMLDSNLRDEDKLKQLQDIVFEPAARDIVANFIPSEWEEVSRR